jgi:nitrate reductase (NAD(P)H)
MMPTYHIGTLDEVSRTALLETQSEAPQAEEPRPIFLDPRRWTTALLSLKTTISSDTRIFTFSLQHEAQNIGLPTGQHLLLRLRDPVSREVIIRAYTPISPITACGTLDILIKIYATSPSLPGGKMTTALDELPVGHAVEFKGPVGKFEYLGIGKCTIGTKERRVKKFIMICGGSGITPIFQVLRAILQNEEDRTTCLLLDGNRKEEDILLQSEIEKLVKGRKETARVVFALSKPEEMWKGYKGRIGKELLKEEVGRRTEGALVLICGPEAFEKSVMRSLGELAWMDDDLLLF